MKEAPRKNGISYQRLRIKHHPWAKHSKADNVKVSFRLLTNVYRITVTDTGIGFDLNTMREKAVSQKKFGLFSIIERIKYIGGEVNIDSVPKKGTKVVIDIPLVKEKN